MGTTASIGRKAIRITNELINLFVLFVFLLLIVFSCYAIWDSSQIFSTASATNYEIFKPTVEQEGASFTELRAINPDVFAWLTVYGTNIDYPVVQTDNNITYVNTDARGKHSLSGAIFLDYRNGANFSDFSSILYGHHMDNQVMFGEIASFADEDYFNARKYGSLYIDGKEHGLSFFAFLHADAYDFDVFRTDIVTEDEKSAYLALLLDMALHIRPDVPISIDDRIVLLSTCSTDSTNGRDILLALITDEIQDDPFITETVTHTAAVPTIDALSHFWTGLHTQIQLSIIMAIALAIALLIILIDTKRERSKRSCITQ